MFLDPMGFPGGVYLLAAKENKLFTTEFKAELNELLVEDGSEDIARLYDRDTIVNLVDG